MIRIGSILKTDRYYLNSYWKIIDILDDCLYKIKCTKTNITTVISKKELEKNQFIVCDLKEKLRLIK